MISIERLTKDRDELIANLEKLESHLSRLNDAVKETTTRIASQRGAIEYAGYLLQAAETEEIEPAAVAPLPVVEEEKIPAGAKANGAKPG